jgi:hypothetical protein
MNWPPHKQHCATPTAGTVGPWLAWLMILPLLILQAVAADAGAEFRQNIQPILKEYCYDCHGDGANKGDVAFDQLKTDAALLNHDLWSKVLKNTRAGLMPPEKKPRPSAEQFQQLEKWIKYSAFGLDPQNPDPGRVTVRRLNRIEYRNTIRDLMGHDFRVEDELPPDDTGYGFDNIGDVLSISPLLLEKYMQAAETIVAAAVPRETRVVAETAIPGSEFRKSEGKGNGERMSFYDEASVGHTFKAELAGNYRVVLEVEVLGQFVFDPGRANVVLKDGGRELWQEELGWEPGKKFKFEAGDQWEAGEHRLTVELKPLTPVEQKTNSLDLRITTVRVQGPTEEKYWVRPKNFAFFFTKDPPAQGGERREYAREVLGRFLQRAYRRPVDERSVARLVSLAESIYQQPGKRFEDGIAQAIVPVLASPRFLFRIEDVQTAGAPVSEPASRQARARAGSETGAPAGLLDEYSLASRLSYFFWSTMPDEELFRLAERHELRQNLDAQVRRLLADRRSEALIQNFVGQWLQTRDVDGIDINARVVLARDSGEERDFQRRRERFQELNAIPDEKKTPEQKAELQAMFTQRRGRNRQPQIELDRDLRRAMREETEMAFGHVVRENRSVLELLEADYTFLNEKLAKHYGLTNLDVTGPEMRRVSLPSGSPRGGVLTDGAVLVVTSNPTRTSPVKRGLFILDNILGVPPPPPPANIPPLEDAEKQITDHKPTLRESLAKHREDALCRSCHNRMDPLGLALENFNALGMWREQERKQPIDAGGKLITGETFTDVRELKRVLVTKHRRDFYTCLTEKFLTYALGRGIEYYDTETVDRIVARLEEENGRFSALLSGVVESAPFQKRRNISSTSAAVSPSERVAQAEPKP